MAGALEISYQMLGRLAEFAKGFGPAGMQKLNQGAAQALWWAIRSHLQKEAGRRHATASRLGATPTGHLEKAEQEWTADSDAATVTVHSEGISRAFSALRITPRNAKALTIPVHSLGYGSRASEVSAAHRLFRPKGKDYLMADLDGRPTVIYLLRKAVTIPQDRGLMPSDEELKSAAGRGYMAAIRKMLAKASNAPMGPEVKVS